MNPRAALVAGLLAASACNSEITGLGPPSDPATETFAASLGINISSMSRTADGVYYIDVVEGTGAAVTDKTDSLRVTYGGFLKDGTLFDSGTNVRFVPSDVVPGFRSGLIGMKQGGHRKVVIPSELGYGRISQRSLDGKIKIPRQSTLVFDLRLLNVHNPAPAPAPGS